MAKLDYYAILEVDEGATLSMIKKSYRVLAKRYHPDMHPDDDEAAAKFVQINEAYSILSDEKARANYDAARKSKAGSAGRPEGKAEDAEQAPQYKYSESESVKIDFENWDAQFEDFFGFDPRSKAVDAEKMRKKTAQSKTGDAFDAFFGFKPKKK